MSWEAAVELAVQRAGFWLIHLNRVAALVLVALVSLLFFCRMALLRLSRGRLAGRVAGYPPLPRLDGMLLLSGGLLAVSGYWALKPDEAFYRTVGGAAFAENDFRRAITFYEPLVHWGSRTPDVYHKLGRSYLALGRCRPALSVLDRAFALPGGESADARVLSAVGHECVGDVPRALSDLERALALSRVPEQQEAIRAHAEGLRRRFPRPGA